MQRTSGRANRTQLAASVGPHHLVRLLGDWSGTNGVLHADLAEAVRRLVQAGRLPSGVRMPSERSLSAALNVSRNTIGAAFDSLRGQGILTSRQGDGTYVSTGWTSANPRGDDRLQSFVGGQDAADASEVTRVDLRSAALPGLPIVADEVDRLTGKNMMHLIDSHGYAPAGLPVLREEIAAYYSDLGLPTRPAQVLVTSGAQQALRLAASSLLARGATVLIEEPSFRGAIESLRALGARLVPLPRTGRGAWVRETEALIERTRASLIVVQSTVHNPTGLIMEPWQRKALAEMSSGLGVPVIDDATLSDTTIGEAPPIPLPAFGGYVIAVGSFSKSFWGGLRVGWLRADVATVERLASIKTGEDLGTSLLAQAVAAALLPQIVSSRHLRSESLYEARQAAMAAVAEYLPEWRPITPSGGASLWIELPDACATSFATVAGRDGIRLLPGPTFSCVNELDNFIRISYAGPIAGTTEAIRSLGQSWERFRRSPAHHAGGSTIAELDLTR
ncbi:PLP-dependent aminotransferase family protein [Microbacterium sp. DT81.1]|uniref:aminotransferase-like domain-containing protein n=1 Tax=Microbacterium sp. DT81.1 TaxID=3393413 RepID=UPI003CEF0768